MSAAVHGDGAFFHSFEKRALGLAGGTVYLVREKKAAQSRAGLVVKAVGALVIDGKSRNVGRKHVGSKLHTLVVKRHRL